MLRTTIAALALFTLAPAEAASFDCAKARTPDEHAVCGEPRLSALDYLLARAHAEAGKAGAADDVREVARDFMADRRACGSDRSCVLATYAAVLNRMSLRGASTGLPSDVTADTIAAGKADRSPALPDAVGRCVATTVDGVHPRLGDGEGDGSFTDEDFESGTGIDFRNGGYQVSYDRVEALIRSKPGDDVVLCLVSVPHRCPPDDDRGREYMGTNERTGDTWILPDSQHACGGA